MVKRAKRGGPRNNFRVKRAWPVKKSTRLVAFLAVFVAIGAGWLLATHAAEAQLGSGLAMYPRAIRLAASGTANGRVLATASATTGGVTDMVRVYESTDSGASFHAISEIHDPQASGGRGSCCGSIYELPQQLGAQPAGTLLFGTTVGMPNAPGRSPEIRVWKSSDHGYTWSYLSSCAAAPNAAAGRGLWEPEFSMDARGYLNCFFSDDTQYDESTGTGFDQTLAMATSTDGGVTWGAPHNVVAVTSSGGTTTRPGMATVRKLPNGTYMMSHEVCGHRPDACIVRYRTSADGWNWGDPADLGAIAQTPDGKRLFHAPTLAWTPGGGANGRILLIGELVKDPSGNILRPASGTTIFANTENGAGSWYELASPVSVSFTTALPPEEMVCNNYSSSLLPSASGTSLLEVATKRASDGTCTGYFASGPTAGSGTAAGVSSGKLYRLQNVKSANCLDVSKGATTSGANVQQWTCNGLNPQNWTITSKGSGYYTLVNKQSGKCLDVYKSSTVKGGNVDQWTCNGTSAQLWKIMEAGRSYYNLKSKVSGLCLDVQSGSVTPGANVQQWTCNNSAAQNWEFELR